MSLSPSSRDAVTNKQCTYNNNSNSNNNQQSQIYKLIRTIGQGGFSKIKLVKHLPSGELVAMKEIDKQILNDDTSKKRFIKEITFFKTLSHPHLIPLYEVIESDTHYYFVIKYADNGDLLTYINEHQRLSEHEAKLLFAEILQCVMYLHQQCIAHRDLKPENILLINNYKTVIVSDLGLANRYEQYVTLNTVCGSPHYAAPEMIMGQPYTGECVDVWSLGVLLYVMVIGRLPFSGSNQEELYMNIANVCYKFPFDVKISNECKDIIERMLVHDPQQRITLCEMKGHAFMKDVIKDYNCNDDINIDERDERVVDSTITCLKEYGIETSKDEIKDKIDNNIFDQVTTCYKLLKQKMIRDNNDNYGHNNSNSNKSNSDCNNNNNNNDKCNMIINKTYRPKIKNKLKLSPSLSKTEIDNVYQKELKNGVLTIQDKTRRRNNNNLVNDSKTFQSIKNYSNRIIQTESSTSNSKRNIHIIHQSSNTNTKATTTTTTAVTIKERKPARKDPQYKDTHKINKLIKTKMSYATAQNKKMATNLQYIHTPSKNIPNVEVTTLSKKINKDILPPRTTIDLNDNKCIKGYAYSKRQKTVQSCSTKSIHNTTSSYRRLHSQRSNENDLMLYTSPRDTNKDVNDNDDIVDCKVIDKIYSHRLILNTPITNKMKNMKNGTLTNEHKLNFNYKSHYTSSFLDINVNSNNNCGNTNSKLNSLHTITGFSIYNSHNRKHNDTRKLSNNKPSKNNTVNSQDHLQHEPKKKDIHKSPSIKQVINTSLKKHISHNIKNPFTPKKCLITINNTKPLYSTMKHKYKDKDELKHNNKCNRRLNSPNNQMMNHENVFLICTTKLDENVIKRKVSEIAVDKGYVIMKIKDKNLQLATKTQHDVINICIKLKNGNNCSNTVKFSHVKGDKAKTKEIVQSVLFGIGFD